MNQGLIDIGEIVNTHGLKGEVKVIWRTDTADFFLALDGVYDANGNYYAISACRFQKNGILLKLKGIDTANDAERMRGTVLYTKREYFDDLPEGVYLIADILGLTVKDDICEYGKVTDVLQTGSNDVYVVEKKGKKPLLIPVLKDVIKEVNLQDGYICVELPAGLLEEE